MFKVAVLGAGKIGDAICGLLSRSGRYEITLADQDLSRSKRLAADYSNITVKEMELNKPESLSNIFSGNQAVISALPFHCNPTVAEAAAKARIHYLDLTEDVNTTQLVSNLALKAKSCFIPQCGLAPGFISIAAAYLVSLFDKVDTIKMRVGALPIYPTNRLKYNLTWSTEGLINEYGNMCDVIVDGKKQPAYALEGYERISLDGVEYEAFNTSGGLGSLCDTLEGKVRALDYKSVRYPGHHELVAFLMQDLRFNQDRETLRQVLERSVSFTAQDKCLVFVEVTGDCKGRFAQKTYASTVYNQIIDGKHFGAIQLTTAAGICAALDLLLLGFFGKESGIVRCEDIPFLDFLNNEFGKYYKDEQALDSVLG